MKKFRLTIKLSLLTELPLSVPTLGYDANKNVNNFTFAYQVYG